MKEYLNQVPCNHSLAPASLFKKTVLEETNGYNECLGHWTDSFLQRFAALKYGSVYIPEITHAFTSSKNSFSINIGKSLKVINYLEETTKLMKSADFSKYFPSEYTDSWEIEYRKLISKSFNDNFDIFQNQKNLHLSNILDCKETSALTKKMLSFFIKSEQFLMNCFVKGFSKKFLTHTFK